MSARGYVVHALRMLGDRVPRVWTAHSGRVPWYEVWPSFVAACARHREHPQMGEKKRLGRCRAPLSPRVLFFLATPAGCRAATTVAVDRCSEYVLRFRNPSRVRACVCVCFSFSLVRARQRLWCFGFFLPSPVLTSLPPFFSYGVRRARLVTFLPTGHAASVCAFTPRLPRYSIEEDFTYVPPRLRRPVSFCVLYLRLRLEEVAPTSPSKKEKKENGRRHLDTRTHTHTHVYMLHSFS